MLWYKNLMKKILLENDTPFQKLICFNLKSHARFNQISPMPRKLAR